MEVNLPRTCSTFDEDALFRNALKWLNFVYLLSIKINVKDERLAHDLLACARAVTHQLCNEELKSESEFEFICENIQRCSMMLKQAKQKAGLSQTDYDFASEILSSLLEPVLDLHFG